MQPGKQTRFFYGWYIVAIAFLAMLMVYGVRYSFSVFYIAIMDSFGWSRAETAGIFSVNMVVYGMSSLLGGYLIDRFGARKVFPVGGALLGLTLLAMSRASAIWHFYILYGVVLGLILSSMGYVAFATVLSPWFSRMRGAAMGIAFTGSNIATLISTLAQYFISTVGWRGGFQILGIAAIVVIVPGSAIFLRRRPEDIGLLPDGATTGTGSSAARKAGVSDDERVVDHRWASTPWTLPRAMKTGRFWALVAEEFLISTALNFIVVHQVAYSVDVGFSKMYAATVFGLTGVFGVVGAFGGALSDRWGREKTYVFGYGGLILSLAMLMAVGFIRQPWILWAFAITYGVFRSITTPLYGANCADLFQGKNLGTIMGIINWGFGFGAAFGSWLAGYIFDLTKSYNTAFLIAMGAYALATLVTWTVTAPRRVRLVPGQARNQKAKAASPAA